jgi:hypothetical protein
LFIISRKPIIGTKTTASPAERKHTRLFYRQRAYFGQPAEGPNIKKS